MPETHALLPDPDDVEVRAAGGLVWRDHDGTVQVLVIHRSRYDDWSLPKGKLDQGETFEQAAVREIEEETGVRGALGRDLGRVDYQDHKGRPKVVRFWAVRADEVGQPTDTDEVDEFRWLDVDQAAPLLTYASDRDVLDRFGRSEPSP